MILCGLIDDTSAHAIDVAWFRHELMPVSEYGRRKFDALTPYFPGQHEEALQTAQHISQTASMLDSQRIDTVREVLSKTPDLSDILARISMGRAPSDADLLMLLRACDALAQIDALIRPALQTCGNEHIDALANIIEAGRSGRYGFYLGAGFDERLRHTREAYEEAQSHFELARSRIAQRVASELGRERIESDEFIVMRDTLRQGVPQHVHIVRESPTYFLCELELDDAALMLLQVRDDALVALTHEEERVREELGVQIRRYLSDLDQALERLGDIDLLIAQARFTRRHSCVAAEYSQETQLDICQARFVPLQAELEHQGRRYVAIDVHLDAFGVLTGPNMGGKSACLRTCASIALLAAFGIPVPAVSARVSLFSSIAWLGVGAEHEQGGLLSAFASEVMRLRDVLGATKPQGLILIDEFARTTNPAEGMALLVAVIAELRRRSCIGLLATHLAGIAAAAQAPHFAVMGLRNIPHNVGTQELSAVLAALGDAMDYRIARIEQVDDSHADAIALAGLLGLDAQIIVDAYAAFAAS